MNKEATLLQSIATNRDQRAYHDLYQLMARPAFSLALHLTSSRTLAEEVVQEAMLRVWRHAHSFKPTGEARSWILRIVARESLRCRKREGGYQRRKTSKSSVGQEASLPRPAHPCDEETLNGLGRQLQNLPDTHRQILILRFGAGYSQHEIGAALGLPQTTVSRRMRMALNGLRIKLQKEGLGILLPFFNESRPQPVPSILDGIQVPPTLAPRVFQAIENQTDADGVSASGDARPAFAADELNELAFPELTRNVGFQQRRLDRPQKWHPEKSQSDSPSISTRKRFEIQPQPLHSRVLTWVSIGGFAVILGWIGQPWISIEGIQNPASNTRERSSPVPTIATTTPTAARRAQAYFRHWDFNNGPPTDLRLRSGSWIWEPTAGVNNSGAISGRFQFFLPLDCPNQVSVSLSICAKETGVYPRLHCNWFKQEHGLPMKKNVYQIFKTRTDQRSTAVFYIDKSRRTVGLTMDGTPILYKELPEDLAIEQPEFWRPGLASVDHIMDDLTISETGWDQQPDWAALNAQEGIRRAESSFDSDSQNITGTFVGQAKLTDGAGLDGSRAVVCDATPETPVRMTLCKSTNVTDNPFQVEVPFIRLQYFAADENACKAQALRPVKLAEGNFDYRVELQPDPTPLKPGRWQDIWIVPQPHHFMVLANGKLLTYWKNHASQNQMNPYILDSFELQLDGACRIDNLEWSKFTGEDTAKVDAFRLAGITFDLSLTGKSYRSLFNRLSRMGLHHPLDPLRSNTPGDF